MDKQLKRHVDHIDLLIAQADHLLGNDEYEQAKEITHFSCIIICCYYEQLLKEFFKSVLIPETGNIIHSEPIENLIIKKINAQKVADLLQYIKRNISKDLYREFNVFFSNNSSCSEALTKLVSDRNRIAHAGNVTTIAQSDVKDFYRSVTEFKQFLSTLLSPPKNESVLRSA